MAGVSTKEIKNRIRSMESTRQITKAMEMVAASKLRRAQAQVLSSRPYFEILYSTIADIASSNRDFSSPYLQERPVKKALYIVIAGDRGLAGGYNSNVMNLAVEHMKGFEESNIFCIGQMARDFLERRGYTIDIEFTHVIQDPTLYHAHQIAETVLELYNKRMLDEVYVVYTHRISTMVQRPEVVRLLPVRVEDFDDVEAKVTGDEEHDQIIYEPSITNLMELLIPQYLIGIIYSVLVQSFASEQCARMNAMDSATRNANEMIDKLSHELNRARQSAITNELAEIISGADALEG